MVSDQGQALEAANLLVSNRKDPFRMKVRKEGEGNNEPIAQIKINGKNIDSFEVEYLLVKIAAGIGKTMKFAYLKNNLFPPSSRGKIKTKEMK